MNFRSLNEGVGEIQHIFGGNVASRPHFGRPAISRAQTGSVFPIEFLSLHTQCSHSLNRKIPRE
jgi:hypothetical protein